jgi:small ribosomal subunit Rsm22
VIGKGFVRQLEDDWRGTLDGIARARGWPTSHEVERLGAAVEALSRKYNRRPANEAPGKDAPHPLAARLGFSFARDVPKGAAAVRELVAASLVATRPGPLRVLDLGAGLGAMTWGVQRALEASGRKTHVEATWVDEDAEALEVGRGIVRARARPGEPGLVVRGTLASTLGGWRAAAEEERFDLVLVGQVLSELDLVRSDDERVDLHASILGNLIHDALEPDGALVVVEPALRDRTRHLHRVRDALVARQVTLFAPCLHSAPCPALAEPSEWCHEDLDVDLPPWLVPVARAAGLRFEGLSFSYLVLRKDGVTLASRTAADLRVVSRALPSKGKCEAYLCGSFSRRGERVPARARVMRLVRDERGGKGQGGEGEPGTGKEEGRLRLDELSRGDLVTVEPLPEAPEGLGRTTVRLSRAASIERKDAIERNPSRRS